MASRATWKGTIKLGLVSLAVAAYKATDEAKSAVSFRQLHSECGTPINQKKWCKTCDKEVSNADITKGYEAEKDKFVTFTDDEVDELKPDASHTIAIDTIVDESAIDNMHLSDVYYVTPESAGTAAEFAMLRDAMRGKIAIGTWVYSQRSHLVGVQPKGDGFLLHMLRLESEIRPMAETTGIGFAQGVVVGEKEMKLAKQVVAMYEGEFDPSLYKDEFREEFNTLLTAKLAGQAPEPKAAKPKATVTDLMAALEASVKAGKPKTAKARIESAITSGKLKRKAS